MKIFKSLIPVAAVAAVTTPLITSCSHVSTYSWTMTKEQFEKFDWIKPEEGEKTESQGSDYYFESIKNNPEIFAQDLLFDRMHVENNESESLGTFTVKIVNINLENKSISYELIFKGEAKVNDKPIVFQNKVICQNIKVRLSFASGDSEWKLSHTRMDIDELKNDKTWSLAYYVSYPTEERLVKINSENIDYVEPEVLDELRSQIGMNTIHYMSKMRHLKG